MIHVRHKTCSIELDGTQYACEPFFLLAGYGRTRHVAVAHVLSDGRIEVESRVFTREEFVAQISSQDFTAHLERGMRCSISHVGSIIVDEYEEFVQADWLIRAVDDAVCHLNGRPTTIDRCREAFAMYTSAPTDENRRALEVAYGAIPGHLAHTLCGQKGDIPIRTALGLG